MKYLLGMVMLVLVLMFTACEDDTEVDTPVDPTPVTDVSEQTEADAGTTEESDVAETEESDTTATEDASETDEEVTETETDVEEPEPEPEETPEGDPTEFKETNFRFSNPTPGDPGGDD